MTVATKKRVRNRPVSKTNPHRVAVIDRGVDGWERAFEISAKDVDRFKIGGTVENNAIYYKIVSISKLKPLHEGSVVVRVKVKERTRLCKKEKRS